MINSKYVKQYCCENPYLIENYSLAISDKNNMWEIHHRLETELNKSKKELKELNLYFQRPASELICMLRIDHQRLHMKDVPKSEEHKKHISESQKGENGYWYGKNFSEEHKLKISIGNKGKSRFSLEQRKHMSEIRKNISKPKFKWETPSGEICIMDKANATRFHPDWKLIE